MWLILALAAFVGVAVSRSPREAPSRRQLLLAAPPPPPGPIAVLGELVRIGQAPPPTVILCAIAEAEALGLDDLASDIIRVFVAPVVQQHAWVPSVPYAIAPSAPTIPAAFVRESCAVAPPSQSPRDRANAPRAAMQQMFTPPPRALAPRAAAPVFVAPQAPPQRALGQRSATDDEIRAMLNADPEGFIAMATRGAPPIDVVPVMQTTIHAMPPARVMEAPAPVPAATPQADAVMEHLGDLPGHAGSGVTLVDPAARDEVFDVRWLRGFPIPALPQVIDGRAVRITIVDSLPVAQASTELPSALVADLQEASVADQLSSGLPPEMVVELQDAGALPAAEEAPNSSSPGSPLAGVTDDAWREFVKRLERKGPQRPSSRHVGRYRQCVDRLADLGIDPRTLGSAQAQRAALDVDLVDAYKHADAGELLAQHVGRTVVLPGRQATEIISLSGVLGVIQCAGLVNAANWLELPGDRKRFPITTRMFLDTNRLF